ncbi:hypothetical protein [Streptomyces coffeae]|uniref:HEAT repeat domain-containing protein n=1 Tax=Streptomyces coffeae TaxID=621382 RepID=A0ABS1NAS5_9ACTN|nr:hypothetical protein [Streptomyces coffeae]MBL1097000.1 hypothetical protein [Streptomyces coffeae]
MVEGFHSFHWQDCELGDAGLNRALDELMAPTERSAYLRAFRTLLHSENTVAAGIALDHFQYSGALTRWGRESALDLHEADALTVARKLLRQPPMANGANHASALNAMMNIAQPEDADLIADALALATDVNVRSAACTAAGAALYGSEEPSLRLLTALGDLVFDEHLDIRERAQALSNVGDADCPEAIALLVRATESTELDLQVQGAIELTTRGRLPAHRERLERLVAAWPADAGSQANDVRKALSGFHSLYWTDAEWDDPELGRAHEELMFPSGAADDYHQAFRTLLRSDHPMAVGIALDHFTSYDGLREVLDPDEVDAYGPEVIARARDVLRRHGSAALHLSALNTLGSGNAEASDAEPIMDLLEHTTSGEVRDKALWVALGVLKRIETPDPRFLDLVGRCAVDQALSGHQQIALRVLGEAFGPEANPFLVRAVDSDDVDVQIDAAWQLSHPRRVEEHRELLVETVGNWPALTGRSGFLARQIRTRVLGPAASGGR